MQAMDRKVMRDLSYYLPDSVTTMKLAEFFALFSDSSRLRVLSALAISELCVTDLASVLQVNQTTLSHQLKQLRSMGLVSYSRNGRNCTYYLTNNKVNDLLLIGVEYIG